MYNKHECPKSVFYHVYFEKKTTAYKLFKQRFNICYLFYVAYHALAYFKRWAEILGTASIVLYNIEIQILLKGIIKKNSF